MEEVQLNWCLTAKDGDKNGDLSLGFIDGGNSAKKIGERSFYDADGFRNGEGCLEFGSRLFTEGGNGLDFIFGKRGWLIGGTDKAGNSLGSTDSEPRIIGDDHFDKHVSGEEFLFDGGLLTFGDLDLFLSRDEDLEDPRCKPHGFNTSSEGDGDAIFMARLGVNDVPLGGFWCIGGDDDVILIRQFGADRFDYGFVDYFFHFICLVPTVGDW